jgi:hypothetical protein
MIRTGIARVSSCDRQKELWVIKKPFAFERRAILKVEMLMS